MTVEDFVRLVDAEKRGTRWAARCPAHADSSPSLSISEGDDGRILLRCWAGCQTVDVLRALKLTWLDLFPDEPVTEDDYWQALKSRYARRDREERFWLASGYLEEDQ